MNLCRRSRRLPRTEEALNSSARTYHKLHSHIKNYSREKKREHLQTKNNKLADRDSRHLQRGKRSVRCSWKRMRRERTGGKVEREKFGHHNTVSKYEQKEFKQSLHECCASIIMQSLQTLTIETRRCLNKWNHLKAAKKMKMWYFPFSLGAIGDWGKNLCCYCMKISKGPEFMLL